MSPNAQHLLLVPFPVWGHTRPLCALGGRFVEKHDVTVTILTTPNWLQQAHSEIATYFPNGHEALQRIRIVSLFDSTSSRRVTELIPLFNKSYPTAYEALFQAKPITCATMRTTFNAIPAPDAVIMDFFAIAQLRATRAISGKSIPIFAFVSSSASAMIRLLGPESLGGLGDFGARTDAEALRTGKKPEEIGDEIFKYTDGTVVKIDGLPNMYDYEWFPQILPFDIPMAPIVRAGRAMFIEADGVLIGTCDAYDKESLRALGGWITGTLGKQLYPVGPLLPSHYMAPAGKSTIANDVDIPIQKFLDVALSQYGENSAILISFGTIFWPTVPEQLEELIDALIEKQFPFILAHASPLAVISETVTKKIETSGVGIATPWCPQQLILNHPATGWFMGHGGHGGVTESLAAGVPMICWPFDADQPSSAEHLTRNLNVAFHLMEIRTGKGLKPLFSGQTPQGGRAAVGAEFRRVFDECRSKEGEEKRRNTLHVQAAFTPLWDEGGSADTALREFLQKNSQVKRRSD
ncbi:UDP-Glycosyltransferase/glycogen phosphorylase [Mycena rebaudengoi]|nr:UDP-Glycosyltransferase/glycogen phosphorylase [Mycena rebaudengoi]